MVYDAQPGPFCIRVGGPMDRLNLCVCPNFTPPLMPTLRLLFAANMCQKRSDHRPDPVFDNKVILAQRQSDIVEHFGRWTLPHRLQRRRHYGAKQRSQRLGCKSFIESHQPTKKKSLNQMLDGVPPRCRRRTRRERGSYEFAQRVAA